LNILIIGFGSIGRRHFKILKSFQSVNSINIVSKQNIDDVKSFKNLDDIEELNIYDYFIISSKTVKHYEQLKYMAFRVKDKKILVEKPLYDKNHGDIETNNHIFTAYNLRFHPILQKLKEILKNKKIYYANIICGQYLPTWRLDKDYRLSYSADINQGGGVLRDLSHELDYINWLFGKIDKIEYINTKISDLDIKSDDIFTAIALTKNQIIINVSIDYISKTPIRRLIIHTQNSTIEANLIDNKLIIYDKNGNQNIVNIEQVDRNFTYTKMHQAIIDNDFTQICSFKEGKEVLDIIEMIKYEE